MALTEQRQLAFEFDASRRRTYADFVRQASRELVVYRHAIANFITTSLSARYRRSVLGFFWSLLNPLFTLAIMSVVFALLYKRDIRDFGLYLFSGLLPWNFINASIAMGADCIISAERYLKKMYVPRVAFPVVSLGIEFINLLFSLLSMFIVMLLIGARFRLTVLLLPAALLLLAAFLFGLILMVSAWTVFFRDLSHIIEIALRALFYVTPILYPLSLLDNAAISAVLKLNPFYYFITLSQELVYSGVLPAPDLWAVCLALSVLSLLVGTWVFHKLEMELIFRL